MDGKSGKGTAEEKRGRRKDAGVYFKKITERLQAYADRRGFRHDVTYAQGKVLFYLHTQKGGEATMKSVENYLDVSHATVSGIVSRLKEKGYVECEKCKDDARAKTVRLTEKEYASFAEMKERRADMEKMLLKDFSDKERAELFFYLERVYKNVREAAEGNAPCKERRGCGGEENKTQNGLKR
ncbi:MAG: MarR family winged helix-turn-helix transcriptional regulator [Candidatus Scatosoma sp.]